MREIDINALTGVELMLTCDCNKVYPENNAVMSSDGLTFCSDKCMNAWEHETEGDEQAMEREQREAAE